MHLENGQSELTAQSNQEKIDLGKLQDFFFMYIFFSLRNYYFFFFFFNCFCLIDM